VTPTSKTNLPAQPLQNPLWAGLAGWLLLTFAAPAASIGSLPDSWYAHLAKPSWAPPNGVFAPVWTTLYILMAFAAWQVWRKGGWKTQTKPLRLYILQLALNAVWTPLFFRWHQPAWALALIFLLWVAIALTLHAFSRVSRTAAWLLAPYLLWVGFATALNWALWRLNP
jgi:benzodiazapine receptor